MVDLLRTNSDNPDFKKLVLLLDQDLRIRDGDDHAFYAQFNKIDKINHVVIAFNDDIAVGCGAIKQYADGVMEVKRMFVKPEARGKGIASKILFELEIWAKELGNLSCILETGFQQPEAIALYHKSGYIRTENYGQYAGIENSACFIKSI